MNRSIFHTMDQTQRTDYLRLRLVRAVYHCYTAAKVATAPTASPATVDRISHIYSASQRQEVA